MWVLCLLPLAVVAQTAPPTTADSLAWARDLTARGDHERAAGVFRALLSGHPDDATIRAGLAHALVKTDDPQGALRVVRTGLERHCREAPFLRTAAGVFASQGQYADAIEVLQQAIVVEPGHALDRANLGGLYTKLGRFGEARAALLKALDLDPASAVARRRLGLLYLRDHRYEEALVQLRGALALDSGSATTHFLLAQALEGSGELDRALSHYDSAAHRDPSYAEAHYRSALLARRLGHQNRADSAMAAFRHLQSLGADDSQALKQLHALRQAVVESGDEADHIYALARFLLHHGYNDEALNRFEAVVRRRPTDFRAFNQIGNIYLRRRELGEALDHYGRAARLAPDFAPAALNAGNAAMLMGQPQRAVPWYERVTALNPALPQAWLGLADAYLRTGRTRAAAQALERGLQRAAPQGETRELFLDLRRRIRAAPPGP